MESLLQTKIRNIVFGLWSLGKVNFASASTTEVSVRLIDERYWGRSKGKDTGLPTFKNAFMRLWLANLSFVGEFE